jgi:hypothetical protein
MSTKDASTSGPADFPETRTKTLSHASTAELNSELKRRRRRETRLLKKRVELLEGLVGWPSQMRQEASRLMAGAKAIESLQHVESELTTLRESVEVSEPDQGGGIDQRPFVRSRKRRRAPRGENTKTLQTHLEEALTGRTLSVSEAADVVVSNGYVTKSKSFRTIVNQTLLASGSFVKVSRGRYTRAT